MCYTKLSTNSQHETQSTALCIIPNTTQSKHQQKYARIQLTEVRVHTANKYHRHHHQHYTESVSGGEEGTSSNHRQKQHATSYSNLRQTDLDQL